MIRLNFDFTLHNATVIFVQEAIHLIYAYVLHEEWGERSVHVNIDDLLFWHTLQKNSR